MKISTKLKELRELSSEELTKKITDTKKELFALRLKQSTGTLENSAKIKELRKDVARMKTIMRERELKEVNDGK